MELEDLVSSPQARSIWDSISNVVVIHRVVCSRCRWGDVRIPHPSRGLRSNPASVLRDAASAYKVDTDAIALKVKQEFATKDKAKKTTQPATKAAKQAA
jgi:hypothetical protein